MKFHIIETERPQHASEFFFEYHENIGMSSEFKRLLEYIIPDYVHVLIDGKIVKSGNKNLALELENKGYDWL